MGSPGKKYWSGLPCPPPGDVSPALAGGFLPTQPPAFFKPLPDTRSLVNSETQSSQRNGSATVRQSVPTNTKQGARLRPDRFCQICQRGLSPGPQSQVWKVRIKGSLIRGMTEEMAGWHHRLKGHESEQAPGVGDGHGGLACCGPWRRNESGTTEGLN